MPWLLTRTSRRSAASPKVRAAAWMLSELLTSRGSEDALPPTDRMPSAACRPFSSSREAMMTWKPRRASCRAASSPMPRLAPVMSATRSPFRLLMVVLLDVVPGAGPSVPSGTGRSRGNPALDELDIHPVGVGGDDAPDSRPEGLRLLAQEGDALLPKARGRRVDVRDAERDAVDAHVGQGRVRAARGQGVQPFHQVDEHPAGRGDGGQMHDLHSTTRHVEHASDALYLQSPVPLRDDEPEALIEPDAPFEVPAGEGDVEEFFDHARHPS